MWLTVTVSVILCRAKLNSWISFSPVFFIGALKQSERCIKRCWKVVLSAVITTQCSFDIYLLLTRRLSWDAMILALMSRFRVAFASLFIRLIVGLACFICAIVSVLNILPSEIFSLFYKSWRETNISWSVIFLLWTSLLQQFEALVNMELCLFFVVVFALFFSQNLDIFTLVLFWIDWLLCTFYFLLVSFNYRCCCSPSCVFSSLFCTQSLLKFWANLVIGLSWATARPQVYSRIGRSSPFPFLIHIFSNQRSASFKFFDFCCLWNAVAAPKPLFFTCWKAERAGRWV